MYNSYINNRDYMTDLQNEMRNNQRRHEQVMREMQRKERLEDKVTDKEDRKKNKRLRKIWDNICLASLVSMPLGIGVSTLVCAEYCESISKTGPHMLIPLVPLVSYIALSYLTALRSKQIREKQYDEYTNEIKLRRNQNK